MKRCIVPPDNECLLCAEVNDHPDALSSILDLYPSQSAKILAETDSLVLIRDISPIVEGHSLVVTKKHYVSFAQAPQCVWTEMVMMKKQLSALFQPFSNAPFFFEHGSCSDSSFSASCIAHAHIHVIPTSPLPLSCLEQFSTQPLQLQPIEMVESILNDEHDYLYYENSESQGCVITKPIMPLPRQLIRMVVARQHGILQWDWIALLAKRANSRDSRQPTTNVE